MEAISLSSEDDQPRRGLRGRTNTRAFVISDGDSDISDICFTEQTDTRSFAEYLKGPKSARSVSPIPPGKAGRKERKKREKETRRAAKRPRAKAETEDSSASGESWASRNLSSRENYDELPAHDLCAQIERELGVIYDCQAKSSNLKGTTKKTIKDSVQGIKARARALTKSVMEWGDTTTLRLNARCAEAEKEALHKEVQALREEVAALRRTSGAGGPEREALEREVRALREEVEALRKGQPKGGATEREREREKEIATLKEQLKISRQDAANFAIEARRFKSMVGSAPGGGLRTSASTRAVPEAKVSTPKPGPSVVSEVVFPAGTRAPPVIVCPKRGGVPDAQSDLGLKAKGTKRETPQSTLERQVAQLANCMEAMQRQLSQLIGAPDPPPAPRIAPTTVGKSSRREGERSRSRTNRAGPSQETDPQTWVEVVRRGKKSAPASQTAGPRNSRQTLGGGGKSSGTKPIPRVRGQSQRGEKSRKRRPPKAAAVAIRCPPPPQGQDAPPPPSYADIIRTAKAQVSLETLEITDVRIRRDMGGGILVEIPGPGGADKADRLATALTPVLAGKATVSRPCRRGEVRLTGLDESVGPQDVLEVVTSGTYGLCREADVSVGPVTEGRDRLGAAWVRCPLGVAERLAEVGRIRVGWSTARAAMLPPRQLQCYRCLEFGHVRQACRSEVDRSRCCYRCGKEGHVARDCKDRPRCVLCDARGLGTGHRAGGPACPSRAKGRNGTRRPPVRRTGEAPPEDLPEAMEVAPDNGPGGPD